MVTVKVRETYDLCTVKNKMTVIGVHTPEPSIIKRNYPGLLLQCKAYRPKEARVAISCASVLPLDPRGVGLASDDVAPEDVFNPILYKATSNFGMSQIEARIQYLAQSPVVGGGDVDGNTAIVDVDSVTNIEDEFPVYYGLLSNSHGWKKANPQAGLEMRGLKPLVWETLYSFGDNRGQNQDDGYVGCPGADGTVTAIHATSVRGNAKPMPFINTTSYTGSNSRPIGWDSSDVAGMAYNAEKDVPYIKVLVGAIIIPPSRLHQLFYRMVVEWDIEFSAIRPVAEIANWSHLGGLGNSSHYQNYSYENTKEVVTGDKESIMDSDTTMVSANVDIKKVM